MLLPEGALTSYTLPSGPIRPMHPGEDFTSGIPAMIGDGVAPECVLGTRVRPESRFRGGETEKRHAMPVWDGLSEADESLPHGWRRVSSFLRTSEGHRLVADAQQGRMLQPKAQDVPELVLVDALCNGGDQYHRHPSPA